MVSPVLRPLEPPRKNYFNKSPPDDLFLRITPPITGAQRLQDDRLSDGSLVPWRPSAFVISTLQILQIQQLKNGIIRAPVLTLQVVASTLP